MLKDLMAKQKAKGILQNVFKSADIGISYAYGQSKGKVYPKIRSVKFDYENKSVKYAFSLPAGLDPKEIKKKEYAFKQVFGKNIEIKGDIKEYSLTVYALSLPSELFYDYEQYKSHLKGKKLPVVAGIDLNGEIVVYDMLKNPHLLIAGETGSGKSTQLRSVISTLIQALPPERLELYLSDLKRSEFHVFRHVKHVKGLFNSARAMLPMLNHLKKEMEDRGDLLDRYEVAHIDDVPEPPPYIVLGIDEFALLKKEKDLWDLIEQVSSIGRALGVFLLLSVLRPDRNIMDGALKNNLTVRMGFRCSDAINSKIVGTPGSEKLTVEGRMLLKISKEKDLKEIQAPFLTVEACKKIMEGYRGTKPKNDHKGTQNNSDSVIDLKESQENIFEVLDECEDEI